MTSVVVLRPMLQQDIGAVAMLCGQLGYPTTEAEVETRYLRLASSADDALVVASEIFKTQYAFEKIVSV